MHKLENAKAIERDALNEALALYLDQTQRGVAPITTVTAAAMLIGQIIGSAAKNREHIDRGLEHLASLIRLTAADHLQAACAMNN